MISAWRPLSGFRQSLVMKLVRTTTLLGVLGLLFLLSASSLAQDLPLFEQLKGHAGKAYAGKMTFPDNKPNDPMNKPMRIEVIKISDNHIRIPLRVGDDNSRVWMLTRIDDSILLKHDHRAKDGTPDDLTNYGGVDAHQLLGRQLIFPADAETAALLPEAKTNVWSLRLSPDGKVLYYYLERDGQPRFEATFDLTKKL